MKKRFSFAASVLTIAALLPQYSASAADLTLKGVDITAARGETAAYQILLQNNPRIDEICYAFSYDPSLTPAVGSDDDLIQYSTDFSGMNHAHWSPYTCGIAFGSVTKDAYTEDGMLTTFRFTVPRDAMPGTVYQFAFLENTQYAGFRGNETAVLTVDGSITVSDALPFGFGDANIDGRLTIADAVLLARVLAEDVTADIKPEGRLNADVDGTNGLSSNDLTAMLKLLAGKDPV